MIETYKSSKYTILRIFKERGENFFENITVVFFVMNCNKNFLLKFLVS